MKLEELKRKARDDEFDKISISKWRNSKGEEGIEITILDRTTHELIYCGDMKLDDFVRCITGAAQVNIKREEDV